MDSDPIKKIEVDPVTGTIVDGHARAAAMKAAGYSHIPVDKLQGDAVNITLSEALVFDMAAMRKQLHALFDLLPAIHKPGSDLVESMDDLFNRVSKALQERTSE